MSRANQPHHALSVNVRYAILKINFLSWDTAPGEGTVGGKG